MEKRRVFLLVLQCLFGLISCDQSSATAATTQNADKSLENTVLVHFMDIKRAEFINSVPKIKSAFAKNLNDYCADKINECSNFPRMNISTDSIEFAGHTDKEKYHEEGRFVVTHMRAKIAEIDAYRRSDTVQTNYLPADKFQDFVEKNRESIVSDSGVQMAYVNSKLIYPSRNNIDNWVIISVSCVFCLFLFVFNLICQKKINKQMKEEFLAKVKSEEDKKAAATAAVAATSEEEEKERNHPLLARNEVDETAVAQARADGYLEPVNRFPIPPERPITATTNNNNGRSNIRTNPHMRLTQV